MTDGVSCSLVDLATVCTPEMMAPILTNAEVQQRLLPFLPSGESLLQSADEIQNTINSPQFQQVTDKRKVTPNKHNNSGSDIYVGGSWGSQQFHPLWKRKKI